MHRNDCPTSVLEQVRGPGFREKFSARLERVGECLEWTGPRNSCGYGVASVTVAHRVAWMLSHGRDIPPGHEIDHLCRNRACCEPEHLESVTRSENEARKHGWSNVRRAPLVRIVGGTIHERPRVGRVAYLLTWREMLADGSRVQRGCTYPTREDAEMARTALEKVRP